MIGPKECEIEDCSECDVMLKRALESLAELVEHCGQFSTIRFATPRFKGELTAEWFDS